VLCRWYHQFPGVLQCRGSGKFNSFPNEDGLNRFFSSLLCMETRLFPPHQFIHRRQHAGLMLIYTSSGTFFNRQNTALFSVDKVFREYYGWMEIGPTIGSFIHWREVSPKRSFLMKQDLPEESAGTL
jgi:hypothetical protein